jgi:hypothetical protein
MLGLKQDEVTGGWSKVHIKELHSSYFTKYLDGEF